MPPQTDTPRRSRLEQRQDRQVTANEEGILTPEATDEYREECHVIIDVREPHEYEEGHVPGALNIPRGVLEIKMPGHDAIGGPDSPICIYCGSGGRTILSAQRLQELGYTNVTSIEGGIKGRTAAGLPIQTATGTGEEE